MSRSHLAANPEVQALVRFLGVFTPADVELASAVTVAEWNLARAAKLVGVTGPALRQRLCRVVRRAKGVLPEWQERRGGTGGEVSWDPGWMDTMDG